MSTEYFDIAAASSLDLASATTTSVAVGAPALNEGGATIASLDANGLLIYKPEECGAIALANGSVVKAIRPQYRDGTTQTSANYESQAGSPRTLRPLLLRAADGGSITLVHDAAPPTPEPDHEWETTERIAGQYGNDVVLLNAWVYVQWDYVAGARRWRAADWGAFIGDPANFATTPTSQAQALDRIAAAVSGLLAGPIPD